MANGFKLLLASSLLAIVGLLGFIAFEYHQANAQRAEAAAIERESRAKAAAAEQEAHLKAEQEAKRLREEAQREESARKAREQAEEQERRRQHEIEQAWPNRAGEHVVSVLKNESGVAKMVLDASHPSGRNPSISDATHVVSGETVTVYFSMNFNGGWSGNSYTTKLKFSFAKGIYKGYELVSDNAAFPIDEPHRRQLDEMCKSICNTVSTQLP